MVGANHSTSQCVVKLGIGANTFLPLVALKNSNRPLSLGVVV
jgi:hypothetical protein